MSLKEYKRKRDFKKTSEPASDEAASSPGRRFIVQKHAASRLHYDFRLELDGTLKSWAVPRGIPYAKGEKRLAVHVEDHPVSYFDFEGTIPKGQYGGGTVMVWDHGSFEPATGTPERDLESGKLHFTLHGSKLDGEWYLVRLRDGEQWLLIRGVEDMKKVSKLADDTSALSGRSMKQIANGEHPPKRKGAQKTEKPKAAPSEIRTVAPKFVEPMKAKLMGSPPPGDWNYEIKFDGFRALAVKAQGQVRLLSRNEKDFSARFPELIAELSRLPFDDGIIDGEIVALDKKGRSSFQLLQGLEMGSERPEIFFYAFDILHSGGVNMMDKPLEERRKHLAELLADKKRIIRYSDALGDNAKKLMAHATRLGLEGLIGKKKGSRYEPGKRTGAWIKLKLQQEQEFVIGGYTDPEGSRSHIGSILVGVNRGKKLHFSGKVGTGFNRKILESLHTAFKALEVKVCPFSDLAEARNGKWWRGMTGAQMKRCHWVKPLMVCEVKFAEWTREERLRQPVYLGLREDKKASEVVREKAS